MRKSRKPEISFIILTLCILILVSIIIVANVFFQDETDWKKIVTDLLNDILSVAIVGVVATIFTKIISDNFFKIKKNNDKLISFGVDKIGEGKSTVEDTVNLFGNEKLKKYPSEIKLMFITGNGFFKTFEKDLVECLQNSDCSVKILLMSIDEENKDYIDRCEYLCPQKLPYSKQLTDETLVILNPLMQKFPGRIEIRYFKDEYRYNFRIAQYRIKDGSCDNMCWLNIQPFSKDAIDLSIGLAGSWNDSDKNIEENIFYQLDKGFNLIWEKYKPTV